MTFDIPAPCLSCMCKVMNAMRVRSTIESRQSSSRRAAFSSARTAGAQAIVSNRLRLRLSPGRHALATSASLSVTSVTLGAGLSLAAANNHAMGLTSIPSASLPRTVAAKGPFPPPTEGVENCFLRLREVDHRVMDEGLREHCIVSPESVPSPGRCATAPNTLVR